MTETASKLITADELLKMGEIGRCELIYGELVMMSPAGFGHGEIASRIVHVLEGFVEVNALGITLTAEAGFKLEENPDLVRVPDVSFVRKERIRRRPKGYFPGAPDLAVEIISPGDTKREIAEKVNMWLAHGTVSVWIADPDSMTITIHRTGKKPIRLGVGDELRDEPALPGFTVPLTRIFKRP